MLIVVGLQCMLIFFSEGCEPPKVDHLAVLSDTGPYNVGYKLTLHCEGGYTLHYGDRELTDQDPKDIICSNIGIWQPPDGESSFPTCKSLTGEKILIYIVWGAFLLCHC